MIFKQLLDYDTFTYTYILADEETKEGVIIDPVLEQVDRDYKLIQELGIKIKYIIDTHVHADHITGAVPLRKKIPGSKTVLGINSGAKYKEELILVKENDQLKFGKHVLTVYETPGHTNGCTSFVLDDGKMVFTGDALFIRSCGRTDFQQGSNEKLYKSITKLYSKLPESCIVYPGHDYNGFTSSTIGEEMKYNPRLFKGQTLEGFAKIMDNLNLAPPKKIDVSLRFNFYGGQIDE